LTFDPACAYEVDPLVAIRPETRRPAFRKALSSLAASEVIRAR